MVADALLDRLGLNTTLPGAMPLDGDLAALDPSTSPLQAADAVLETNATDGTAAVASDPALSPQSNPIVDSLNDTVLDFHASIEGSADQTGTVYALHGLTNLGETVGLGKIGEDNLVTHVVDAPGDILSGNLGDVAALPNDVTNVSTAAVGLVNGALMDVQIADSGGAAATISSLANGGLAAAVAPVVDSPLLDPTTNPITSSLSAALPSDITQAVTNLEHTVGLGAVSGDNLVTHVLDAPSDILAGNLSDVTALPGDVGTIANAATGLVGGTGLGGSGLGGTGLDSVVTSVDNVLGHVADAAGLTDTGSVLSGVGTAGAGGLVTDVQHVVSDGLGAVPTIVGTVSALGTAVGADLTGHAAQAPTLANLLGTGSEPGAHDVADASAGPTGNGGAINILGTPVTDGHTLDIHALALPATAPAGIAIAALGEGGLLHFGSTGGGGSDALSGVIQQVAPAVAAVDAAPAAHAAPELPIDLHALAGLDHLVSHHA